MDRLNYFNPYNSSSDNHEDRFTRGLLALVRLSPLVATYFYGLLKVRAQDKELPEVYRFNPSTIQASTQRTSLPLAGRYYSVLISDDVYTVETQIIRTDRVARYDGVLQLGESIFFIEVKPFSRNVWVEQLSPSTNDVPDEAYLHPNAICISTRTLLKILDGLLDNPSVTSTEQQLIGDFHNFVDAHFPELNPFDTYAKCLTYQLAQRKTESVLQEIAIAEDLVQYHQGWGHYIDIIGHPEIRKIGLLVEKDSETGDWIGLRIAADFGSTQGQAKAFYNNQNVTLKELDLVSTASPVGNLHFAKITSNVIHFTTEVNQFTNYFNHWKVHGPHLRQLQREDFESYYQNLKNQDLVQAQDANFVAKVMAAGYQNLNVCPAVYITRSISREEVLALEADGKLVESISATMQEILGLLGRDISIFRSL